MKEIELKKRFEQIKPYLDEKARSLWCANEAICMGRGGITFVASVTGLSRTTITEGARNSREIKRRQKEMSVGKKGAEKAMLKRINKC